MKKQDILENKEIQNLLFYASKDNLLSSNDFRLLFFIATNDNITIKNIKDSINIKDKNTISKSINCLINNNYISRDFISKTVKKGLSSYDYFICVNKQYDLKNHNSPIFGTDSIIYDIDKVYTYFFDKFPLNGKKSFSSIVDKKQIALMIEKDGFNFLTLKHLIDFVSLNNDIYKISRPIHLRKKLKLIEKDMED